MLGSYQNLTYPEYLFIGGAGNDTFVGNFLTQFPNTAITWDARDTSRIDVGNGVNVEGFENIRIRTGNENDDIIAHFGSDYVDTSGGDDVVIVDIDFFDDEIRLGAGDDLVRAGVGGRTVTEVDKIYGGLGYDTAFHYQTSGNSGGLRLDIEDSTGRLFGGQGVGSTASIAGLTILLVEYVDEVVEYNAVAPELRAVDAANEDIFLNFIDGGSFIGKTNYHVTVEGVGVYGSDVANDLVMFYGGAVYLGGDGPGSSIDTLVGEFTSYEDILNASSGLDLRADGSITSFCDSRIGGFERLVVSGTSFTDRIFGGSFGDVITGEDGDDVLYGGTDNVFDYVLYQRP